MALAGLDPEEFLNAKTENERARTLAVARAATALRASEAEALAVHIANKVVKAMGG